MTGTQPCLFAAQAPACAAYAPPPAGGLSPIVAPLGQSCYEKADASRAGLRLMISLNSAQTAHSVFSVYRRTDIWRETPCARTNRNEPEFKMPLGMAMMAVIDRAFLIHPSEVDGPREFERRAFGDKSYAMSSVCLRGSGITARELVRAILVHRIASGIIRNLEHRRGGVVIPPSPRTPEFMGIFQKSFGLTEEQAMVWTGAREVWPDAIAAIYYRLMERGVSQTSSLQDARFSVELRQRWHRDMLEMGIGKPALEAVFRAALKKSPTANPDIGTINASAWFQKFEPDTRLLEDEMMNQTVAALAHEMSALHLVASALTGDEFLALLPAYFPQMTFKNLRGAMKGRYSHLFEFAAFNLRINTIWHSDDAFECMAMIMELVGNNKKYKTLEEFCNNIFGVTREAFLAKIGSLASEGARIGPLIERIRAKFGEDISGLSIPAGRIRSRYIPKKSEQLPLFGWR